MSLDLGTRTALVPEQVLGDLPSAGCSRARAGYPRPGEESTLYTGPLMGRRGRSLLAVISLFAIGAGSSTCWAYPPAPDGPALESAPAEMDAALSCPDPRDNPERPVVLLVHGTGTTARASWPNSFGLSLPTAGFDWCMVDLPNRALGDIQTSAEYVVHAVRRLADETGKQVDLIGHSQGAVEIRWAVRFWPDVRAEVDDLITLAGANQGVSSADTACGFGYCAEAVWQMRTQAKLEAALNEVPAPPGPSYTAIYSEQDELIRPASAGAFEGASNIRLQDVCGNHFYTHVSILYDAVPAAVVFDALSNPGSAEPSRIPPAVCNQVTAPGIDPAAAPLAAVLLGADALSGFFTHPTASAEPPLRPYATGPAAGPSPDPDPAPSPDPDPAPSPDPDPAPSPDRSRCNRARAQLRESRPETERQRGALRRSRNPERRRELRRKLDALERRRSNLRETIEANC
jgi:triacylglycerol lipase